MDFDKIEKAVADEIVKIRNNDQSKGDSAKTFPKIIRAAFEAYEAEKQEQP